MKAYACIVLLSILACIESVQAFQHYGLPLPLQLIKKSRPPCVPAKYHKRLSIRHPSTILFNQNDDENDDETSTGEEEDINTPESSSNNKRQPLVAQITYTIFNIFSYTTQFLGVLFTLGLILNLFGYGYRYDTENGGLEINKLEYMRNEIQFEREILREEKEDFYLKRGADVDDGREELKERGIVFGNWGKSVLGK